MILSDREMIALLKLKMLIRQGNPDMPEFLSWMHTRMHLRHNEPECIDYMQALKRYAEGMAEIRDLLK